MDKIHSMHVYPIKNKDKYEDGLIALVNIVVYIPLCVRSIAIFRRAGKYHLHYPSKDNKHHYVHPVNKEDSLFLEQAIISKVKQRLESVSENDLPSQAPYGTTSPTP